MVPKLSKRNLVSLQYQDPIVKARVEIIQYVQEELLPLMNLSHIQAYKKSLLKKDTKAADHILQEFEESTARGIVRVRQSIQQLKSKQHWHEAIARELHDTVLQNLTTLFFELQYCQKLLNASCLKALEEYSSLKNLILDNNFCMDEFPLRHSRERDSCRLVPSLYKYAERFSGLSEIEVQIDIKGEKRTLSSEASDHLFLVVKEALINAKKHARARKVNLDLVFEYPRLSVNITDDGRGFVCNEKRNGYFGIKGMKERAQILGGLVKIHSRPGQGTKVSIEIPLNGNNSDK